MIFIFFAVGVTVVFLPAHSSRCGLVGNSACGIARDREPTASAAWVRFEGSIFGLMGLLLAFTISGAPQRFDDRRQLVMKEATAATTAYDRLTLFEGDTARPLQVQLKDYVRARVDLYCMPHDFSLLEQAETFSPGQQSKLLELKDILRRTATADCPQLDYGPRAFISTGAQQPVRSGTIVRGRE